MNNCNERIVRLRLDLIRASEMEDQDQDDSQGGGGDVCDIDKKISSKTTPDNQGSSLIDATCATVDIRYPTDLSLLNEAREVTEVLIDTMYKTVRESFDHKPRTHRKQARQQFLAVAKKKHPRINKIRRAIKQQLAYLRRNLTSIDALTSYGGCLLAAGRAIFQNLLVVSKLVRQKTILYHSESKSIPDRIVSLRKAHVRPIIQEKARPIVEFGAKFSMSVTGNGLPFLID